MRIRIGYPEHSEWKKEEAERPARRLRWSGDELPVFRTISRPSPLRRSRIGSCWDRVGADKGGSMRRNRSYGTSWTRCLFRCRADCVPSGFPARRRPEANLGGLVIVECSRERTMGLRWMAAIRLWSGDRSVHLPTEGAGYLLLTLAVGVTVINTGHTLFIPRAGMLAEPHRSARAASGADSQAAGGLSAPAGLGLRQSALLVARLGRVASEGAGGSS